MPTINLNSQTAFYKEWGNQGPTILMLHGWPADSTHYEKLGLKLANLGYKVIVPDLPGWGKTPPPDTAWSVSDYRDWVHDFVEFLNLEQFILFGHSFGGRIAIKYAINYPYKLTTLVLCSAAGIRPDHLTYKKQILKLIATVGKKIFSLPGIKILAPGAKKLLYKAAGSHDYNQAEGIMKETIVKVLEEDLSALLPQISGRTLVLWGTEDGATPFDDGKKMSKLIPKAELKIFTGIKHNLPKLIPDQVAEAIDDFVKNKQNHVIE